MNSDELGFLRQCLSGVSEDTEIDRIDFTESDFEQAWSRIGIEEEDVPYYHQYFRETGDQICSSCHSVPSSCSCLEPQVEDAYVLNTDAVVEGWRDFLGTFDKVNGIYIEDRPEPHRWDVKFESPNMGEITFQVVADRNQLSSMSGSPDRREFPVSLRPHDVTLGSEWSFVWTDFSDESSIENLLTEVRKHRNAKAMRACNYSNVEGYIDTIQNSVIELGEQFNYQSKNPNEACSGVADVVNFDDVLICIHKDDTSVLLCNCESRPKDLHTHHVENGNLQDIEKGKLSYKISRRLSRKASWYEWLTDTEEKLGARTRAVLAAGVAVNIDAIASLISDLGGLPFEIPAAQQYGWVGIFLTVLIGTTLVLSVILPALARPFVSWRLVKLTERF